MLRFKKPINIPLMKGFQKTPYLILVRNFLVDTGSNLKATMHKHMHDPTVASIASKVTILYPRFSLERMLEVLFFAQMVAFSFGNASNSIISREVSIQL